MTTDPSVRNAVVGWPCTFRHCKERRMFHIELLHHIESDHSSVEELEGRIISDSKGRILALAPMLVSRHFPDVGLPQEELINLLQRRTGAAVFPPPYVHLSSQANNTALPQGSLPSTSTPDEVRPSAQAQHPLLHELLKPISINTPLPQDSSPLQYDMPPALPVTHLPSVSSLKTPARSLRTSVSSVPPAYSPDSGRGSESSLDDSSFVQHNSLSPNTAIVTQKNTEEKAVLSDDDDSENSEDSDDSRTPILAHFSAKKIIDLSRSAAQEAAGLNTKEESGLSYLCPVPTCKKTLGTLNGLKYHARSLIHQRTKAFRCGRCDKKKYNSAQKQAEHLHRCTAIKNTINVSTRKRSKRGRNDSLKEDEGLVADLPPALAEPSSTGMYSPSSKLHQLLTSCNTSKATSSKSLGKRLTKN